VEPRVAVLITYYNERALLQECLQSLLSQPGVPDEIIVYDDSSTYPAEDYVTDRSRVRVVQGGRNRGPAHARNRLLELASSEYVHFHDADDLFLPEWSARVRRAISETQADAIFTEVSSVRKDGTRTERVLGLHRLAAGEDLVRFCVQGAMLVPAGTYRRSRVLALGGYREELVQSEDFDFHIRLAASGPSYAVIADPFVLIRVRAESRSQDSVAVWSEAVRSIRKLVLELGPEYRPDLADAAAFAGLVLYRQGARREARAAFSLAREVGPPALRRQHLLYRVAARFLGLEGAERVATLYRRVAPPALRSYLAGPRTPNGTEPCRS
jgi:glycosyltransferase involved in cell wall biosynthesis